MKKKPSNIISGNKIIPAPPNPKGKPATILYKKLPDDMILITGFENFLSLDDIFDKYGRTVTKTYADYPYSMVGVSGAIVLVGFGSSSARIGELFGKQKFSSLIAHVKKCGSLLHDIIRAVNDGQVRRIEI